MTNHNSDDCNNGYKKKIWHEHQKSECQNTNINSNSKLNFAGIAAVHEIYFGNHKTGSFVIDSGASCHVANDLKLMTNVRSHKSKITIADQNMIEIEAIGDIQIECENSHMTLLNCMYCPSLAVSLISVSKLDYAGAKVSFEGNQVIVSYKDHIIMKAVENRNYFILNMKKSASANQMFKTSVGTQSLIKFLQLTIKLSKGFKYSF